MKFNYIEGALPCVQENGRWERVGLAEGMQDLAWQAGRGEEEGERKGAASFHPV